MLQGFFLGENATSCPYLPGREFISENYIIDNLDSDDFDALLGKGYRHFGKYFFRPVCSGCHECLPIRVPVKDYTFSRNAKRLLNKNRSFKVSLVKNPVASEEKYALYLKHKQRFQQESETPETFDIFSESFFTNFRFSRILEVYDGEKIIAVTHLDIGEGAVSAVYCYYDTDYSAFSLGKYSIYKGIALAKEHGKKYYYLGYYIKDNPHMSYKALYKPNEVLLEEGMWVPGTGGDQLFRPKTRLFRGRLLEK